MCNLLPPNFSLKLFADDVKLYSTVISNSDAVDLQRCLRVISAWSDAQQLKLFPSKCTVMHLSPRRANRVFTFPYAINNQVLPVIDSITDLGVTYDNHLLFVPHINKTVNKPSQRANLILRCCKNHGNRTSRQRRSSQLAERVRFRPSGPGNRSDARSDTF